MAKAVLPAGYDVPQSQQSIEIDLKEPWLAALLAWLVPGMGHIYQGRTGKGILFFVCVLGTFVFGLVLGQGKVRLRVAAGAGAVALAVLLPARRWSAGDAGAIAAPVGEPRSSAAVERFMAPPLETPQPWKDDSGRVSKQPNELGSGRWKCTRCSRLAPSTR
jgi:TM2 domain-containing membrane protein YozV